MMFTSEIVLVNEEQSISSFKNRYNINLSSIQVLFKEDLERYYQENNSHMNYDDFLNSIGIYTIYEISGLSIISFIMELSLLTKEMAIPYIYNTEIIIVEKN